MRQGARAIANSTWNPQMSTMRWTPFSLLALWLFFSPAMAGEGRLTILHFNDFHGQLAPYTESDGGIKSGGIARLAATVQAVRAEDPSRPVLLMFAGDILQGTMLSTLFHGVPDMELFNAMGMDAAALGNHELDYGQENLRTLLQTARFPVLAANVRIPFVQGLLQGEQVLELPNGLRVGVLGLTTSELVTATHPRNSLGASVTDPLEVAKDRLPKLDMASDLLVVLSHLGFKGDLQLASHFGNLDLVVGGHNHFRFERPQYRNGVLIVQAGERGRWLGRMDLRVQNDQVQVEAYRLISLETLLPENAAMVARVAELSAQVSDEMDRVVGRAAVALDGRREIIRRTESNLGNLVADLARVSSGAQLVLLNSGGFRDSIPAGPVTLGQIQRVFPFGNTLVQGRLKGSLVLAALERGAALNPMDNPGGFLQVSGLHLRIHGGHVQDVTLDDGSPLVPEAQYRIAISDFLAAGGDGYAMFREMTNPVDTGHRFSDLLVEAFRDVQELGASTDGRIKRLP